VMGEAALLQRIDSLTTAVLTMARQADGHRTPVGAYEQGAELMMERLR
jgi:hypothetical protein